MIAPSVLYFVLLISLQLTNCRRVKTEDMDNEIGSGTKEYLVIDEPTTPVVMKKIGDHIELSCGASGSPPPIIQWYTRNQRLTENESYDTNVIRQSTGISSVHSRLVINYLLPRHQDKYICAAEGPNDNRRTSSTKVTIIKGNGRELNYTQLINAIGAHHLPRITFWASSYFEVMGNDVVLPCKSVGNPKPNQMWINQQGKVVEHDEKYSILPEGGLKIRNIEWADMGEYICSVENSVGVDSVGTFLYPMRPSVD